MDWYRAIRPLMFRLDAERAHRWGLAWARIIGSMPTADALLPGNLEKRVLGHFVPSPIGLAAGMDKDGVAVPYWFKIGFGFVEVGTVTPEAQTGNDRPRMWRHPEHVAITNALGFPNLGAEALARRLSDSKLTSWAGQLVIASIGKAKDTPNSRAVEDYAACARALAHVVRVYAINVSSPNTEGLRDLQQVADLQRIVAAVRAEAPGCHLLLKLSPDLTDAEVAVLARGLAPVVEGFIVANTTKRRPHALSTGCAACGGLSGPYLRRRMFELVHLLRAELGTAPVVIASGGISSTRDALKALWAGADLVQILTALVYEGPSLPGRMARELETML